MKNKIATLDTDIKNAKNVLHYLFGEGTLSVTPDLLQKRRKTTMDFVVFFIDVFFKIMPRF